MLKSSNNSYKASVDYYPEDLMMLKYIFQVWRKITKQFGYLEYNSGILEPLELYIDKTSQEIVSSQTYNFIDRGGRNVVLRPEMTPTVTRMVINKQQTLSLPIRWFSIANCFRYERPQKGRKREFWQLNVDIFGVDNYFAELEIIRLAVAIMHEFGAKPEDYLIRINSRELWSYIVRKYLQIDSELELTLSRLLDQSKKISNDKFNESLSNILSSVQVKNLQEYLRIQNITELIKFFEKHHLDQSILASLNLLFSSIDTEDHQLYLDLGLMRGFDYYTGIVFEFFDSNPQNPRSMFGGGRYDNLISTMGGKPLSAVGFGLGEAVLNIFLNEHNLLPELTSELDFYIYLSDLSKQDQAKSLADQKRAKGKTGIVDVGNKSFTKAKQSANKQNAKEFIYF